MKQKPIILLITKNGAMHITRSAEDSHRCLVTEDVCDNPPVYREIFDSDEKFYTQWKQITNPK